MENNFDYFAEEGVRNKIDDLMGQRESIKVQIAELELSKAKIDKAICDHMKTLNNYRRERLVQRRSLYKRK